MNIIAKFPIGDLLELYLDIEKLLRLLRRGASSMGVMILMKSLDQVLFLLVIGISEDLILVQGVVVVESLASISNH